MKKYKIGEIAKLAGVSKRTIDYYTNLGLLKPVRSESNYRYYGGDTLARLKMIESMKMSRFTLEEIREHLSVIDESYPPESPVAKGEPVDLEALRRQLKQLEKQLAQLQPGAVASLDEDQAHRLRSRIMLQSMALFQSLILYVNEVSIYI